MSEISLQAEDARILVVLAWHKFPADPGTDPDFDQNGGCTCDMMHGLTESAWREHVVGIIAAGREVSA